MKTILSLILAALLLIAPAAAAQSSEVIDTNEAVILPGGWTVPDSAEITDELRSLVERAAEGRIGVRILPVAFLGTQLVAGRNYAVLCRVSPVVPNAVETFAIVYICEDLNGGVRVTEIESFEAETRICENAMMGGWKQADSAALTDETRAIFAAATQALLGVRYTPVALVSTQVVNGTNRCFLSSACAAAPNAEPSLALVYVHTAPDGSVSVTEIVDLTAEIA